MIRFGFSYSSFLEKKDYVNLYGEGLRVVEINPLTPKDLVLFLRDIGFEITFHIGFLRGINPSYPIEGIRKEVVREILREIEYGISFGSNNFTLHGGYVPWFDFLPQSYEEYEEYLSIAMSERRLHVEALRKSVEEIIKTFPQVKIAIENVYFPFELFNNPSELRDFVFSFENLYVTLDFGHAKISSYKIYDYVNELKERIAKLHLHTNDTLYDIHRPIINIDPDFAMSLRSLNDLQTDIVGIIELHRDKNAILTSFKSIKEVLRG
jgi:sugar phosphate isomerase/epimerase